MGRFILVPAAYRYIGETGERIVKMMVRSDQLSAVTLLILSIFICWQSLDHSLGSIHNPGPGFWPFWLGIILGAMSVVLFIKSSLMKKNVKMVREIWVQEIRWGKVLAVLVALVIYSFSLEYIGFLTMTFLLMLFLLRFIEPQSWKAVFSWTLIGSAGAYLIFEIWLKLRLPKGFLGF
jgi:putative tricarboxylic transport membrane protein